MCFNTHCCHGQRKRDMLHVFLASFQEHWLGHSTNWSQPHFIKHVPLWQPLVKNLEQDYYLVDHVAWVAVDSRCKCVLVEHKIYYPSSDIPVKHEYELIGLSGFLVSNSSSREAQKVARRPDTVCYSATTRCRC